jgi:HD-GYP domain-containing protein (c-di-GMP phosphodiesterase class II)
MKAIPVSTLVPNTYFDKPVFLDDGYILLTPDSPVTDELLKRLKKWKYADVFSEGKTKDGPSYVAGTDKASLPSQTVDEDIREVEHLAEVRKFYTDFQAFAVALYAQFAADGTLNMGQVTDWVKKAILVVRENRHLILRALETDGAQEDFLVLHSVNSTILSLIIGDYLKAPPHRLIELGNACLLHEIGMLKLPGELRRTPKKLSDDERKVITTHTVLGYRLLKSASAPENVALAAIEHHERMDGSGYPRNLPGDKITEYARIIAVACSYDAIVSRRPFRTSSLDGHSAIKDLLQKNRKQYDDRVLKALVYTLSVYPVGTAVLLSNQGRGIVVKTDPEKPRCPVVKVLRDGDGNKLASPPLVQIAESTEEKGVSITGVLSAEEAAELKGSE